MQYPPLVLHLEFKVDFEYARREFLSVLNAVEKWARPCLHRKRSVALVIVTRETPSELVARLRSVLNDNTADWQVHEAPRDVIGRHGTVDTLSTRVAEAWEEIRKRRNPQNVRKTQFFRTERSVNHRERGTISQVTIEPGRVWNHPKDTDGK